MTIAEKGKSTSAFFRKHEAFFSILGERERINL